MGQGILVTIDKQTKELTLPTNKQLDWFLGKYQYSTINVCSSDSEDCIEPVEEVQESEQESEPEEEEQKKEAPASTITSSIWSFFGWK
jgi:hypothetical protein